MAVSSVGDEDIGVIVPYNTQGFKIRKLLGGKYPRIKVGSVEEFQGQVSVQRIPLEMPVLTRTFV
jgi:superfamily I DNA and/or RNA helicase